MMNGGNGGLNTKLPVFDGKNWNRWLITHIYMSYLCLFKVKLRKFSSNNKMFIFRFYLFAVRSMKEA